MRVETVTSVKDSNGAEVNSFSKTPDTEVEVITVAPAKREEPVVTRRELWSYYRALIICSMFVHIPNRLYVQCTTTEIT